MYDKELEYLKKVKRKEITERIKSARSVGNLENNSEYFDAKNEMDWLEFRVQEIKLF